MKSGIKYIVVLGLLLSLAAGGNASEIFGEAQIGHQRGLSLGMQFSVHNFAKSLPLALRVGLARATFDPGNAADARKIFINNNQGGTVVKSGKTWNYSFDFLYPFRLLNIPNTVLVVGPRYARFTGNFRYVGNNEDFDVVSKHWGIGLGLEASFAVTDKVNFLLSGGSEYFFPAELNGHDTSYWPDGEKVNPREDYEYADADAAVNQPELQFRMMVGLSYLLRK